MNNISPFPVYNTIFGSRRRLMVEKFTGIPEQIYHRFLLEFYGKDGKTRLIIKSPHQQHFISEDVVQELFHNTEYMSFNIEIVENVGDTDGSEFIKWAKSFFVENPYQFNIYSENARDISIYSLDKIGNTINRFMLCGCTARRVMFYEFDKFNPDSTQITMDLCVKQAMFSK